MATNWAMVRTTCLQKDYVPAAVLHLLLGTLVVGLAASVAAESLDDQTVTAAAIAQCPELRALVESGDAFESLFNPVVTTEEDLDQRRKHFQAINLFLARLGRKAPLPRDLATIKKGTEYFLIFTGPSKWSLSDILSRFAERHETGQSGQGHSDLRSAYRERRERLDLATSLDPAVVRLREQVRLSAPAGYVYILFYPDRQSMPELIRSAFDSEKTRAVTFFSRYVAIVAAPELFLDKGARELQRRTLPKAKSHELVHAYIKCSVSAERWHELPVWFEESCAVYYSQGGGAEAVTVVTPTGRGYAFTTHRAHDPEEYDKYKVVFEYLEAKLGADALNLLVWDAVTGLDVDPILRSAGVSSYDELAQAALAWRSAWRTAWSLGGLALVAAVVGLAIRFLWRKLPDTTTVEV